MITNMDRVSLFINHSDSVLEYIPIVGAAVSFYRFGSGLRDSYMEGTRIEHRFEYLESKSFSRFVILLIPVLGNLVVAIYDFQRRERFENSFEELSPFEREFVRIQQETFWLPERGRILQLPIVEEGGVKLFRKVYCVNGQESSLLAQTEYRSVSPVEEEEYLRVVDHDEGDASARADHTQELSKQFTAKGWSREGVEIPFAVHRTEQKSIREYSKLQTPWKQWQEHGSPSREKLIQTLQPVVNALKTLHENNIVHRDIKPANIVVDANGQGKLIDWDSWYDCNKQEEPDMTGTPRFLAPELLAGNAELKAVDVFALGITFYVIFGPKTLIWQCAGLYGSTILSNGEPLQPLDQLILDMTSEDPSKRPTMEQVAQRLDSALLSTV